MADGSQFTFDNGLVASAATVSGRTVTITTGAQAVGTSYIVTVANTVTDLQGSALATPNTATFAAFQQPASVKLNELNAHIGGACDLVELRVTASGTLDGIQVLERTSVVHTFAPLEVQKNDIIVLHFGNAACNPGTSTARRRSTVSPWHVRAELRPPVRIYSRTTGITDTDNVITSSTARDDRRRDLDR